MDLFQKAFENDVAYLQSNLDFLGIKDAKGKSLLHWAVLGSAHDTIDYLLSQDMDVNITDQQGESALFEVARKGKTQIAKKLLARYAKVDIKNNRNETALHLACHKGDLEFVRLLLEYDANLKAKTYDDRLPIHYAILAGHLDLVSYLMEEGSISWFHVDANQNTFLHYAARTTNTHLIELFLDHGLDPNALNDLFETPFFSAVKYGTKETVQLLLKHDAFVEVINRRFETPLILARMNDHKQILELLNEWVKSPTYSRLIQNQGLTLAVLNRDHLKVRSLLDKGVRMKKNRLKLTALDYANKYKFTVCINLLKPFE